jgi:hypothetical protein
MVQQRTALKNLGIVRGGQVAKTTSAGRDVPGACRALQAGDLGPDGAVRWATLRWVIPGGSGERSAIHEGDVLVPLRSSRVSSLVARGVPAGTIAVGHWAIITPSANVLPDYLAWYLAHPATERLLGSQVVGSNLPFVPLSALRDLEVEVPTLAVQERIVRVQALHRRQQKLEQRITQARERYINAITQAVLEHAAHPNH